MVNLEHIEFDKICRGCMNKQIDMKPLYGSSLDEMFRTVVNVNVSMGDGLPEQMCVQCVLQISRAFRFRQQCENIDNKLRSYLKEANKTKSDEPSGDKNDESIMNNKQTDNAPVPELNNLESDSLAQIVFSEAEVSPNNSENLIYVQKVESVELHNDIQYDTNAQNENQTIIFDTNPCNDNAIEENNIDLCETQLHILKNIKVEGLQHHSNDILIDNYETFENNIPLIVTTINENKVQTEPEKFQLCDIKSIVCEICLIEFGNNNELSVHWEQAHKDLKETFECYACKKQFTDSKILKRHVKTHSADKPHVCLTCGMGFTEASNLSKHKKKHTGELRNVIGKPHLCSVCGKRFKWASSLSKHMKYHTKHKILKCEYCPKYYVEARSLHIHMRSHTGEKPFVCHVCHKGFTQTCNLEKHLRVHTGEKPFLCNICGKGFSQRGYVAIHLRTHTGEKPYECNECGKCFAGSNTLAIHRRTHTGIKPYTCCVCSKSFARHETLIIHHRTHTGEKPHVCSICDRAFSSSGHLSGHMRSHTGVKTHACSVCDRKFAGSSSLKVHMRSHTGEKPYVCSYCGKAFAQNAALSTHVLIHEPLTAVTDTQ